MQSRGVPEVSFPQVESRPYSWPYTGSWSNRNTAVICVDLFCEVPKADPLRGSQEELLRSLDPLFTAAATRGLPIYATAHPWFSPADPTPLRRRPTIDRLEGQLSWSFFKAEGLSGFYKSGLHDVLTRSGISNLIFCGLPTETAVHSTMRDANDRGFECLLLEDGCIASTAEEQAAIVRITRFGNGLFGTTAPLQNVLKSLEE